LRWRCKKAKIWYNDIGGAANGRLPAGAPEYEFPGIV